MPELTPLEIAEAKAATLADLLNNTLSELSVARALLARKSADADELEELRARLEGLEK